MPIVINGWVGWWCWEAGGYCATWLSDGNYITARGSDLFMGTCAYWIGSSPRKPDPAYCDA